MSDNDIDIEEGYSIHDVHGSSEPESSSSQTLITFDKEFGEIGCSPFITILDGTFFKVIPEESSAENRKITAYCMKCEPGKVKVKGSADSSSNFISHIKRRHGHSVFAEYTEYMNTKRQRKDRIQSTEIPKYQVLEFNLSQKTFEEALSKFVIHSMVPLRTIEDPYFLKIFDLFKIKQLGLKIISRRSLESEIQTLFETSLSKIKEELEEVRFVCTTADVWSSKNRSFLVVTAHWIRERDLTRKSAALACRRFNKSNTFDRIADLLHEVYANFGLASNNIVATTTDNGSDFIKAFEAFGVNIVDICAGGKSTNPTGSSSSSSSSDDSDEEEKKVDNENNAFWNRILPQHLRCGAHILNLCASADINKTLKQVSELTLVHAQVMKKCNILWKLAGRPKSAEVIEKVLGHNLSRPVETRWNSIYDSLNQILSIREKSAVLFVELKCKNYLKKFEFEYISEHVSCTKPVADALDILQAEENTFYGVFLPCLLALRRKLQIQIQREWIYCEILAHSLLNSVCTRFRDFFNVDTPESENAAIAAFSHPKFKNKWLACVEIPDQSRLIDLFKQAAAAEIMCEEDNSMNEPQTADPRDDFFNFGNQANYSVPQSSSIAEFEILHYFQDPCEELAILEKYQTIKKLFLKYNTPLSSSAPVERLFSFASMTNLPRLHSLSDEAFEQRLVLKANLK